MNKTYKYTLSSGEKKEITFDVGVQRLAITNANGEDGKTYIAGDGVTIDEETDTISVNDTYIKDVAIGSDPSNFKLYRKQISVSNVSGTTEINLNLVSNPFMAYIVSGSGKDTNNNIIPISDNEKINISILNQTATVTVAEGITLKLLNFTLEYTVPQSYVDKIEGTNEKVYHYSSLSGDTIYFLKNCFVAYKSSIPFLIAITLDPQTNVINLPNVWGTAFYTSTQTEYTYNGHTIYYGILNSPASDSWQASIPASDYTLIQSNGLAQFSTLDLALQSFIDKYFG